MNPQEAVKHRRDIIETTLRLWRPIFYAKPKVSKQEMTEFIKEFETFLVKELSVAYVKGYKDGSGGIAADVMALKAQYEAGVKAERKHIYAYDYIWQRNQIKKGLCVKCKNKLSRKSRIHYEKHRLRHNELERNRYNRYAFRIY